MTTVILVDLLTIFSMGNLSNLDLEGDLAFLALLAGNLCVHLFFLVKSTVIGAKEKCRRSKCRCGRRNRAKRAPIETQNLVQITQLEAKVKRLDTSSQKQEAAQQDLLSVVLESFSEDAIEKQAGNGPSK